MGSLCLSVCLSMTSRESLSASRDFLRLCPKSIHILLPPPSSPIHHHFHHHYTIYIVALYLFLQLGRFHRYSVENIHRQQTHTTNSKQQWSTKIKRFSKLLLAFVEIVRACLWAVDSVRTCLRVSVCSCVHTQVCVIVWGACSESPTARARTRPTWTKILIHWMHERKWDIGILP